jgi:hypothetical protein
MVAIVGGRTNTRRKRGEARPYPIFPPAVHCSRTPIASASAANFEPVINRGILRTDMLELVGVLRRNVTRVRLAMADWRAPDQSRVLRQRWERRRTCGLSRRSRASYGLRNRCWTVEQSQ